MIDLGQLFGRGIAFPPRIGADGHVAYSEGPMNVREAIHIILMTNFNERVRLPNFGGNLTPYLFQPNTVTTRFQLQDRIVKALTQYEPRITIESVEVVADPSDAQAALITITYKLIATQARERVSVGAQFSTP